MQEAFLHFLWQFQYFSRNNLCTVEDEPLQILHPGILNGDAGPDFSNARVKIGALEWVGQIEIHIKSSDWFHHHHQENEAYEHVILHVVWKHDKDIYRKDGSLIPVLTLEDKVSPDITDKYLQLLSATDGIPCASRFTEVKELYKIQALQKAQMQRLQQKAGFVKQLLVANKNDWEETAYQLLARNFGFKLNDEPFLQLAKAVPVKLLYKHSNNNLQREALLFGQAGFLDEPLHEPYYEQLQKEYAFLAHKYSLASYKLPAHIWKFSRLRPSNFPTLRIAHLSAVIARHNNLFSLCIQVQSPGEFIDLLHIEPKGYWKEHYSFGKAATPATAFGRESKENILINTLIPLLVCYAQEKGNNAYIERAIALLEALPAENNKITRFWKGMNMPLSNAFDAQGSLELYNQFCMQKKCLTCPVGYSLLKPLAKERTY